MLPLQRSLASPSARLPVSVSHVARQLLVDVPPTLPIRGIRAGIGLPFGACELSLELLVALEPVAREPSVVDGCPDGAAGLALVVAVAETAPRGGLGAGVSSRAGAPLAPR